MHRALLQHVQKLQRAVQQSAHTRSGAVRVARAHGDVQRLSGLASHLGIPLEDTFTSLQQKVGGGYRGWMGSHQSATRAAAGQVSAIESVRQARIAEKQNNAAFSSSPAGIAAKYRNGLATSAIGGAEGALAMGSVGEFRKHYHTMSKLEKSAEKQVSLLSSIKGTDSKELQLAQQHLAQTKSAKSRYEQMGTARWGRRATGHPGGVSGYMKDALMASGVADLLDPLAIGGTVALGAAVGAYKMTDVIGSFIGAEKPYVDSRLAASRLSGQFGYSTGSKTLFDQFFAKKREAKGWMSRYGITANGADKMLSDYGITGGSAKGSADIVKQLRSAQAFMPYLRGMSDAQLGGISRQGVVAGITNKSNLMPLMNQYKEVIAAGTAAGVDRASSIKALSGAIGVLANSVGFGGSNGNRLASVVGGMMQSGIPSMRSGVGEAATFGNMERALHGAIQSPARATMLMQWMQAKNGGKGLPVGKQLANVFGKSWYSHAMASPGERWDIQTYSSLAKQSPLIALHYLDKIMPYDTMYRAGTQFGKQYAPGNLGLQRAITGGISGVSPTQQAAYANGIKNSKFAAAVLSREGPYRAALNAAAKKAGIDPAILAGVWGAESSGGNPAYSGHGARGPFQFEKSTWESLTKLPFRDASNIGLAAGVDAKLIKQRLAMGYPLVDVNGGRGFGAWGGSASAKASYKGHMDSVMYGYDGLSTPTEISKFRKNAYAQRTNQGNAVIKRSKDMFDATSGLVINFQVLNNSALDLAGNFTALGNALNKTLLVLEGVGKKTRHIPRQDGIHSPYASHGDASFMMGRFGMVP
ncbi:MAG: lysozyme family protein [Acidithiobacillus sp.]